MALRPRALPQQHDPQKHFRHPFYPLGQAFLVVVGQKVLIEQLKSLVCNAYAPWNLKLIGLVGHGKEEFMSAVRKTQIAG